MEYLVEVFEGLVFPKRDLVCDVHERAETKSSDVAQTYLEIAKEVERWVRS